jgi:hypothetical protein
MCQTEAYTEQGQGVRPFANAARFIAPDPAVSDLRCQGLFTYMLEGELFVFGIFSSVDLGNKGIP